MKSSVLKYEISFVVIAKNEGPVITRCIKSIIECCESLLDYEIIFIDSCSKDGTLDQVRKIQNEKMKIYQITKNPNAARARNIGAKNAQFEHIFFVDGDVEICYEFLKVALCKIGNSNEIGCVYGQLEHIQHDIDYRKIIRIVKVKEDIKKQEIQKKLGGGIFLTKKAIFIKLQGFDERFDINEDWDFMLRLKDKYRIVSLQKKMGLHNTISYRNFKRIRNAMLNCNYKCVGFLIRKHIFSFKDLVFIFREEYGNIMGGFILLLIGLSILIQSSILAFICLFLFLLDIILGLKKEPNNLIGRLISHYIYPWIILFGLFFWFPKEEKCEWVRLE